LKRSKQDTQAWVQHRLKPDAKILEKNRTLFRLFETQLVLSFQALLMAQDMTAAVNEHRGQKETLSFQLGKLQKDNKEITNLAERTTQLREKLDGQ
jgi:hypothetical protein